MFTIVGFGEILIRVPFNVEGISGSDKISWGGAEANTLCALAKWGNKASLVSKLPNHKIGNLALDNLRKYGVDTIHVLRGGQRIGLYYYMAPSNYIAGEVVYDRAHSSINDIKEDHLDKAKIFDGVDIFYVTGISLALSGCRDKVVELWDYAKAKGIKLVFDVNYRTRLWGIDEARKILGKFMKESDILFSSPFDIEEFLGVKESSEKDTYLRVAKEWDIGHIARLKREKVTYNTYEITGLLCSDGKVTTTNTYATTILERIGGGDSFVAGILHGILNKEKDPLTMAVGTVLMKYGMLGDVFEGDIELVRSNVNSMGVDMRR